jgi:putative transposase
VAAGSRKKGRCDAAAEAAEIAVEADLAVARVCRILDAPRSTLYYRKRRPPEGCRPGPRTELSDDALLAAIQQVLHDSPFSGEGHRKVRARLRREHGLHTSLKRVLRLMRRAGLLAPQRCRHRRVPRPHDSTIVPAGPDMRWRADATMAWTRSDGWVWVFACVDHFTCEAWAHVAKWGTRHAALQPVYDAVVDRFGALEPDVGRGIGLRHDWGPQYRSRHFLGSLAWLGIADDAAFVGEPETNGCAERWIRTLKEQCLWARLYEDLDDLRQGVAQFVELYNTSWLIQRHGHRTPREAYLAATCRKSA